MGRWAGGHAGMYVCIRLHCVKSVVFVSVTHLPYRDLGVILGKFRHSLMYTGRSERAGTPAIFPEAYA